MSRIFVAGATGVLGRAVVPMLVGTGHAVVGTTRSQEKTEAIAAAGAEPVVVDAYDRDGLAVAVERARPELVVSLLTDLAGGDFKANSRLRREAMPNVVEAAIGAGARRFVTESIAFPAGAEGDSAVAAMERLALETPELDGLVLRFGRLYGPGTWHEHDLPEPPHVSVEAAAHATVAAIESGATGVLEVVD